MMAKVTRTVTLDYDVVEEFKLTYPKQKLSTVLNQLISSYVNLADKKQKPEDALILEKKQALEQKSEIESRLMTIRAQLQKLNAQKQKILDHKEKEWQKYKKIWTKDTREDFEKFYNKSTWDIE